MCKSTSLSIANGRLGADKNTGAFTYYSKHVCSTIDCLLLKRCDFHFIDDFRVGDFTIYSDHAPLLFKLSFPIIPPERRKNQNTSFYYKWDDGKRDEFRGKLISELNNLNHVVFDTDQTRKDSVEKMVLSFSEIICNAAKPIFEHTLKQHGNENQQRVKNKQWFDSDCTVARRQYLEALNIFNTGKSDENRKSLCNKRLTYKKLIRAKKHKFKVKQSREFENLRKKKTQRLLELLSNKEKGHE